MIYPTFLAGREVAKGLSRRMANFCTIAGNLEQAFEMACQQTGSDKAIIFDGSYGSINLTPTMGKFLIDRAPVVARRVEEELAPKWLKQRGIDPETE
jgi:hypothetical protein